MKYRFYIVRYFVVFSLTLILFSNCIEEIEFSGEKQDLGINISGQFTNINEPQIVVIREVLDVNAASTNVGDPIEDAVVQIVSDDGDVIILEYRGKGEYIATSSGVSGKMYQLIVTTSDGQRFESIPQKMPDSVPILSIEGKLEEEPRIGPNGLVSTVPMMNYIMSTRLNDGISPVYAIYRAKGEYEFVERQTAFGNNVEDSKVCYISETNDLGNVFTLSGFDLPNNEAIDREVFEVEYNWKFELNYALEIEQYIIDENTFEYWNRVEQLINESTLFDPPPGRFFGNITKVSGAGDSQVRGFFTVAGKSEIRTFTNSSDLQSPVDNYCLAFIRIGRMTNEALPDFCVDCLKANNSTIIKPDYWPE